MQKIYRILAYLVAFEVVVQAAAIAYGMFGLDRWVEHGGVFDEAHAEVESAPFAGAAGFAVHGMNGFVVVPLLALALLGVSFAARVRHGVRWAALVVLLVLVQGLLGGLAHDVPALGALHGLNALLLFATALVTARRAVPPGSPPRTETAPRAASAA
jgi:heme A synthase